MKEVAVREATRAVESDYTNASAHLFLANSFDALRDPDRILLRYETPWFNELLLANLLSPVGGGPLSQFVSQQEYSKLLEADGIGGSLTTEWRSTSEIRSTASVFGTQGNVSYGIDAYYRNDDGDRPNSDLDLQELYGQLKWQATPDDIFYFLGKWAAQKQRRPFSRPTTTSRLSRDFDFEENQEPGLLLAGWNHRWAPGSNTLFLGGRLSAEQTISDPALQPTPHPARHQRHAARIPANRRRRLRRIHRSRAARFDHRPAPDGRVARLFAGTCCARSRPISAPAMSLGLERRRPSTSKRRREFDDLFRGNPAHPAIGAQHAAARRPLAAGHDRNRRHASASIRPTFEGGFSTPAADQHVESDFRRTGLYAYDYWKVLPASHPDRRRGMGRDRSS